MSCTFDAIGHRHISQVSLVILKGVKVNRQNMEPSESWTRSRNFGWTLVTCKESDHAKKIFGPDCRCRQPNSFKDQPPNKTDISARSPYNNLKMSIWDSFTGKKSSSSSSSSSASSSITTDTFKPTPFDPSEAQDVSSFLTGPSFEDPSQLHPLAGLNQQTLDYLSLEESALSDLPGSQSALPSRGWSDDLCYGTGVTYLSALTVGGAWGLQEGMRRSAGQPPKLRLNSVLNAVTRRGPFLGNSAGVIAMVYNGFNSFIGHARGKHDSANSVLAGALSGMLFKSTRGIRPMMISGGIVASVAGAWAVSS